MILRATVDQTDFRSDQVSTKSLILHFNMLIDVFWSFGVVVVALFEAGPSQTWDVQGQPMGTRALGLSSVWVPVTVT